MSEGTGKRFEKKFKSWHDKLDDVICRKWPDHASIGTMVKALCDYIVLAKGKTQYFELKHTESKTSFSFALIKPHQLKGLMDVVSTGNCAYFLIENGNKKFYMIHAYEMHEIIHVNKQKGKSSVKFRDLNMREITRKEYLNRYI